MKKLLALLLSVVMLLSACALAEEAQNVTHTHRLSDVYLISDDELIDLSGLSLELDVSGADRADACRLHLNSGDEPLVEIGLTMVDGYYVLHLESENLGHVDYAVDPVALLSRIMDQGRNGLIEMLQSLDTTQMAQSLVDMFNDIAASSAAPAAPEPTEPPAENPEETTVTIDLLKMRIEGDPVAALKACLSEPETVEMGGVVNTPAGEINIADGSYTTQEFNFDTETLCTILNMLYLDGEPGGLGDMVRETGVTFEIHGTVTTGEEEGLNQIVEMSGTMDTGESQQTMALYLNTSYGPEGETTAVNYGLTQNGEGMGVGFKLSKGQHEGEAFEPASIDMDSAIVLSDMELDSAFNTLSGSMMTVGADLVSAVLGSLMQALMAGITVE